MTTSKPSPLRDLLYLDFDKAASIWSQFEEGLPDRLSVTEETGTTKAAGTKFGVPGVAGANLGADYVDKRSTLQSRTLHHDVLNSVERRLARAGLLTDLSESLSHEESSPEAIRSIVAERPYLRARGASALEDYRRMLSITEEFNNLVAFVAKSAQQKVKQSTEFKQLEELISAARMAAEKLPDRNRKVAEREKVKSIQRQLDEMAKPNVATVDQWILDGMRLWINTFMPGRINFRVYPFVNCPAFQVLCNLKRDCFVDSDLEHLLYGYGKLPNIPLEVFGVVTSLPSQSESSFDPMREFDTGVLLPERVAFEKAFRGMFGAIEGLEAFVRYSRYPNVTIHPIAVYRSFPANEA